MNIHTDCNHNICHTVTVAKPWQSNTYIPNDSSTYLNCTATNQDQRLLWSIQLLTSGTPVELNDNTETAFNNLGYYEVRVPDSTTIHLLINGSRKDIHQSTIRCICMQGITNTILSETTLVVYGKCQSAV